MGCTVSGAAGLGGKGICGNGMDVCEEASKVYMSIHG